MDARIIIYIYGTPTIPANTSKISKNMDFWGGVPYIYIYMYVLLGPTDLTFKQLFHTLPFFRRCFSRAAVVAVSLSTTP